MARRVLPALLVVGALFADLRGHHGLALTVLLAAIPAAFVLALDCYTDVLGGRCGAARPICAGVSVLLLVLSAALRSPAVVGGVPQFSISALVITLVIYAAISLGALLPSRAVPESA
jgi:hypothetical protein